MKSTNTSTNKKQSKRNIDEDFEKQLGTPFQAVADNKDDYDLPIVKDLFLLNNAHNPMFIRDIIVPKTRVKKVPLPETIVDPTITKDIIKRGNEVAIDIKRHFRENVIPFILGFESADTDLQNDVSDILDENALSILMDYRRTAKDIMVAHLTEYFSKHFNLDELEVKKIISKNLFGRDTIKHVQNQANTTGS